MSKDNLLISYTTTENRIHELEDSICDYKLQIEIDPSDMSAYQLFGIFEKLLYVLGYSEHSIVNGACNLAFNDMRDIELMNEMCEKYGLFSGPKQAERSKKHKKMHNSVNYKSESN